MTFAGARKMGGGMYCLKVVKLGKLSGAKSYKEKVY